MVDKLPNTFVVAGIRVYEFIPPDTRLATIGDLLDEQGPKVGTYFLVEHTCDKECALYQVNDNFNILDWIWFLDKSKMYVKQ